ncbi:M20/M25/M40 family metallo-hydrolase [Sulfitobacter aestuariivivens]|uniref:M20/M25/M40 family metallo-hydrolase n=1 Tax=Sulfitobacter aestuariivivens TaxID=2766981 RepID=UPI00361C16E0
MPQSSGTRAQAVSTARDFLISGRFQKDLADLVSYPTESQRDDRGSEMRDYLEAGLIPRLGRIGFDCSVLSTEAGAPVLVARRIEADDMPTILSYGHGDVVHGQAADWGGGRDPFVLKAEGDHLYGRGTADNKGQHLINLLALEAVLATRGQLGFNSTFLIEMGEERGSPGLEAFCERYRDLLRADVLVASDGPRLRKDRPTVFLGARGALNFDLVVRLRERGRHSGNFGGVLADPAMILAHALASIADRRGTLQVPGWQPQSLTQDVREVLAHLPPPDSDDGWGTRH